MHELPEKGTSLTLFHTDPAALARAIHLLQSRGYPAAPAAPTPLAESGRSTARLWNPSPFLLEFLPSTPGRAADLACGSGREAVCLARHGWCVDAIDLLPDALAKANDLAARSDVTIHTHCHDLTQGIPLPESHYDLVTIFRYLHRPLIPLAARLLRPGGLLLIETFHRSDPAGKDPARMASDGELAALAAPLCRPILARDGVQRNGRRYSQLAATRLQ